MISLCIVNWNTAELLRACLASIEHYRPKEAIEIIVVDNASSDGSASMVLDEFPHVILLANTNNKGFAEGNNQALKRATGDILLLLNPDVEINETTLSIPAALLRSDPTIGAVGIKQIGTDGKIQRSLRSFPTPAAVLYNLIRLDRLFPLNKTIGAYRMTWFDYERELDVDQPMATFLMTTRTVYETVGALDTQFPIFFNDVDWCFRIKEAGWRIVYTPKSSILHHGGSSTGKAKRDTMVRESKNSFLRFYEKHYLRKLSPLAYTMVRSAVMLSLTFQSLTHPRR